MPGRRHAGKVLDEDPALSEGAESSIGGRRSPMAEPVRRPASDSVANEYHNKSGKKVRQPDVSSEYNTPATRGSSTSPEDPDRPIMKQPEEAFQAPWGSWPDSLGLYTGPIFPEPSTTKFTGDEQNDFMESAAEWYNWDEGTTRLEADYVLVQLWKDRQKDKIGYWIKYGAVPGTMLWARKEFAQGSKRSDNEYGTPPKSNHAAFPVNLAKLEDANKTRIHLDKVTKGVASKLPGGPRLVPPREDPEERECPPNVNLSGLKLLSLPPKMASYSPGLDDVAE